MNKKIKLFICILLTVLVTGCTPEYNLEFKDGKVYETLKISNVPNKYNKSNFNPHPAIPTENKLYKVAFSNQIASYSYDYKFNEFYKSNMLKTCYNAHNLVKDGDAYLFQTGNKFMCYPYQEGDFNLYRYSKLVIKIKMTNYDVIENNADKVSNNTYIWYIDEKNFSSKIISIKFKEMEKQEIVVEQKIEKKSFNLFIIVIIVGIIIAIAIILILYALNLNKKRNKL